MKRPFKIFLIISLLLNVFFVVGYLITKTRVMKYSSDSQFEKEVNIDSVRKAFMHDLKTKFPQLSRKKYFFIQIWSTGDWESIKRMPVWDTLVEPINSEMAYVFVCDERTDYAWRKIKEHTSKTRNFEYLNGQKEFITSALQELSILNKKPYKWYNPSITLLLDSEGKTKFLRLLPIPYRGNRASKNKLTEHALDSISRANLEKYYIAIDSINTAYRNNVQTQ